MSSVTKWQSAVDKAHQPSSAIRIAMPRWGRDTEPTPGERNTACGVIAIRVILAQLRKCIRDQLFSTLPATGKNLATLATNVLGPSPFTIAPEYLEADMHK